MQAGKNIQDPFDALMKESFLGLDQQSPENSALIDEVADSIYAKEWPLASNSTTTAVEVAKVTGKGWTSWTWYLSAFVLVASLGYGAWALYERHESSEAKPAGQSMPATIAPQSSDAANMSVNQQHTALQQLSTISAHTPAFSEKAHNPVRGQDRNLAASIPIVSDHMQEGTQPLNEARYAHSTQISLVASASNASTTVLPGHPEQQAGALTQDTIASDVVASHNPDLTTSLLSDAEKKNHEAELETLLNDMAGMKFQDYSHIKVSDQTSESNMEFYMKRSEVTNKQYNIFLQDLLLKGRAADYEAAKPKPELIWNDPKDRNNKTFLLQYFKKSSYDDYPVVCVPVQGMELYCSWLKESIEDYYKRNGKTLSLTVRLPLESEWKAAASAGKKSRRYGTATGRLRSSNWFGGYYIANFAESQTKFMAQSDTVIALDNKKHRATDKKTSITHKVKKDIFTTKAYSMPVVGNNQLSNMSGNVSEVVAVKSEEATVYRSIGGNWNSNKNFLKISAPDEFNGVLTPSPYIGFRPVIMINR